MTAAHCVYYNPAVTTVTFLAGTSNKTNESEGFITRADSYVFHPDLNVETYEFDVACIRVVTPFPFSLVIQPIRLVTQYSEFPTGLGVETSGWGFTVGVYSASGFLYFIQFICFILGTRYFA